MMTGENKISFITHAGSTTDNKLSSSNQGHQCSSIKDILISPPPQPKRRTIHEFINHDSDNEKHELQKNIIQQSNDLQLAFNRTIKLADQAIDKIDVESYNIDPRSSYSDMSAKNFRVERLSVKLQEIKGMQGRRSDGVTPRMSEASGDLDLLREKEAARLSQNDKIL